MSEETKELFDVQKLFLRNFELIEFELASDPFQQINGSGTKGTFNLSQSVNVDKQSNVFLIFFRVEGYMAQKETNQKIAKHCATYRFVYSYGDGVETDGLIIDDDSGAPVIQEHPHRVMLSISYATVRGLLSQQLSNTCFSSMHLPIQSVIQLARAETFDVHTITRKLTVEVENSKI